jgi:gluconokinase
MASTQQPSVVVMGVTGCGKSTIGKLLAEKLGVPYEEGDDLHPPANIAKMAAGHPLDDTDRAPWLAAVADWIAGHVAEGGVISCSALKYRYRERLRQGDASVWFLHVDVDRETIIRRVSERKGHFMPASLVDSQFAALEPLRPDEAGEAIDGTQTPEEIVADAVGHLTRG